MSTKQKGFLSLINEIKDESREHRHNPQKLMECIFTHGNRISYEIGRKSLNNFQKAAFNNLGDEEVYFCDETLQYDDTDAQKIPMYFGMTDYGRIILKKNMEKNESNNIFGYINFTPKLMRKIDKSLAQYDLRDREIYCNEVDPFLRKLETKELNRIIEFIRFNIYHMAPILLYINDYTFSTFYNFNNLIEELDGDTDYYVLNELVNKSLNRWKKEEKIFVFSMYLLLLSGPPARGEEVNGIHFSLSFLKDYFDFKIDSYTKVYKNIAHTTSIKKLSLYEKSKYIADLRKKVEKDNLIYREINGLNLHKKERFIQKDKRDYFDYDLYNEIMKYSEKCESKCYYSIFCDIIEENINENPDKIIEELFEAILNRTIISTNSEIAMTRGFRSPLKLSIAHQKNELEEIFDWKQKEYFCCVVPSKQMMHSFNENKILLSGILTAISKRMEYNSWHYTPGNFLKQQSKITRHFYFPPVMSDITEWSDQHHRGHVFASVNHAIRCPGSIKNYDTNYNAFFDLRLMKRTGDKYSEKSLIIALYYKDILNELYQAWFDVCKRRNIDITVSAYDRSWYKEKYV